MGKLVKKGSQFCIQNTSNGVIGRCFSKRSKAVNELKKAICSAKKRAGKVKSCANIT